MLVEKLVALPVGTKVVGQLPATKNVQGVVESMKDGPKFIRWSDGYVTFPFGWVPDFDEYVAARTEIQPSRYMRFQFELQSNDELGKSDVSRELEQGIPR